MPQVFEVDVDAKADGLAAGEAGLEDGVVRGTGQQFLKVALEDSVPFDFGTAKISGFALIAAVAVFAGLIRTGSARLDKFIDDVTGLPGVLAAFEAG